MQKTESLTPSIDESILRLKGEILAQDWRLNEKRAELLAAAFQCLKQRFRTRQAVSAILTMADNTLDFIRRNGDDSPPECMDFLKEAMAHVVNIHEDSSYVPAEDARLFKSVYVRFAGVKTKIQGQRPESMTQPSPPAVGDERATALARETVPEAPPLFSFRGGNDEPETNRLRRRIVHSSRSLAVLQDAVLAVSPLLSRPGSVSQPLSPEMDALCTGLRETLRKTEALGSTIRGLLREVGGSQGKNSAEPDGLGAFGAKAGDEEGSRPGLQQGQALGTGPEACPAVDLVGLAFGEKLLFVPSEQIAIVRDLTASRKKHYLRQAAVPLKHFGRLLQPLPRQFRGELGTLRAGQLRKLKVPVMTPRGLDLPEEPLEEAVKVVVLTHGAWNGAVLCTGVTERNRTMVRRLAARNGDIAGIGFTQEGEELPLLDGAAFLKREGFKITA